MITEAKSALRAELEMELGAAADEAAVQKLRDEFSRRERAIEHNVCASRCACGGCPVPALRASLSAPAAPAQVDSRPCCFSATVDME
jgi:hypothetical protein